MDVVQLVTEVRRQVGAARRAGKRIGLLPTLGALHTGHARLMEQAAAGCDYLVVSIFVNPLQFGPHEDYQRYPRQLAADVAICREKGVALVFAPEPAEMYPEASYTYVEVERLTAGLCGASRPGHFRGVTTVVAKLFNIVQPDVAYFGQKDAQQVAVVQRMVQDLNFPLTIAVLPTVRAEDGLALSSRNAYLSPAERQAAPVLFKALTAARELVAAGERSAANLRAALRQILQSEPLSRVDYAEVVDAGTLEPVELVKGRVLVALAVYIGRTRLIDNIVLET